MSSEERGVGRGRGWLRLIKNEAKEPPTTSPPIKEESLGTEGSDYYGNHLDESKEFEDATEDYIEITSRIMLLDVNDDGILLNKKLNYIFEIWQDKCKTEKEMGDSVNTIFHKCMDGNKELSQRFGFLATLHTCSKKDTKSLDLIRRFYTNTMQQYFETKQILFQTNPNQFRNLIYLFEPLTKRSSIGRFCNYFVEYLEMLLTPTDSENLKTFAEMYFSNHESIERHGKTANLLNKVREYLATNTKMSKEGKMWLLLVLDRHAQRFTPLPEHLYNFYVEHLGALNMRPFEYEKTQAKEPAPPPEPVMLLPSFTSGRPILGAGARKDTTKKKLEDRLKAHK